MKGRCTLHCFLVLALCLGQLAANAHMIGHLHTDANHVNQVNHASHPIAHAGDHHHHEHSRVDESSSANAEKDCGAYHAFAGLAGLNLASCHAIALHTSRKASISSFETVFVEIEDTQSIRGPPLHS